VVGVHELDQGLFWEYCKSKGIKGTVFKRPKGRGKPDLSLGWFGTGHPRKRLPEARVRMTPHYSPEVLHATRYLSTGLQVALMVGPILLSLETIEDWREWAE